MRIFFQIVEFIFGIGAVGSILVIALSFVDDIKTIFAAPSRHEHEAVTAAVRAEKAKQGWTS